MCGDVNVNYLIGNNRRSQLDAVLHSYNLAGIVKFPSRYGLNSHTVIDSVFIDTSTVGKYDLNPLINGLSDHDTQLLTHGGRVTQICVFNTVNLGTSASSP